MAIADASRVRFIAFARVAIAGQNGAQFLFKNRLDEATQFGAQARFQRIEPIGAIQ